MAAQDLQLHVFQFDRNGNPLGTLIEILKIDQDFSETAEEIAKELYGRYKEKLQEDEMYHLDEMVTELIEETPNFIGNSSFYGMCKHQLVETEFTYVLSLAVNTES